MIPIIAWRNIWRSRTRTFVVIGSVVLGIWALIFLLGFTQGQVNNYVGNVIENETSHIQFHHNEFKEDLDPRFYIARDEELVLQLNRDPAVRAACSRILVNGMLSSSKAAQGILAKGIDAGQEAVVTGLNNKLIDGNYLEPAERSNPIMISERMAEKLQVKLRSKIVMTFQNIHGEITTAAFRVSGIYKTRNRQLDELIVYVDQTDLQRLTELPDGASHEIAAVLHEFGQTDHLTGLWKEKYPDLLVESYKEIAPDLELFNSQIKVNIMIMTAIFMLALIFGIINTMLMAVLERLKELGMLMAIGMNKLKVFFMIMLETIFISLLGAPIGMGLGHVTIKYLHFRGINLSQWSRALEEFGMDDIIRPVMDPSVYGIITLAVILTALLAAIYPSLKAIRLKPVEALRKI